MIQTNTPDALATFCNEIGNSQQLSNICIDLHHNPNSNYEILESVILNAKDTCLPFKYVKYDKHKHKKTKWITDGIIKSIKYRDHLYKQLKLAIPGSPEFHNLKINLKTYNNILRNSIRIAKKVLL